MPAKIFALTFFIAGTLSGCGAGRLPLSKQTPHEKFWHDCQGVILAKPDGFQHFICRDVKDRRWEVLIRREGK